jgi:DnaJ-class molecular chaperone
MKECKHCDGEGSWEIPTISTHEITQRCEYCNGTGEENKELAAKVTESKRYKPTMSVYERIDAEGLMAY